MICYLCGSEDYVCKHNGVRDNPEINVMECCSCGLVYLSSVDHIDNGHYENSCMHEEHTLDIQTWLSETEDDDLRRYEFLRQNIRGRDIIDFGCGAAGFIDYAKKSANNIRGIELEQRLQPSYRERGLFVYPDYHEALNDNCKWDFVTAFHVIEHLPDPRKVIQDLSMLLSENGEMIIEVPNSDDALVSLYKSESFEDFTYWSNHLYLFNKCTITQLAQQAGLNVKWVKYVQRYSLSNHLYWLSNNAPGGHKYWNFIDSKELKSNYENQLASLGITDTIIVSLQRV